MEEHLDRYRMYGLVPYNISPIQQGIQYGHALQEYNNSFIDHPEIKGFNEAEDRYNLEEEFKTWRLEDKTFIILNGGTSMTMEQHIETLKEAGIHIGVFREPDLNMMVTGIVFLVPENVYKKDYWPDFKTWMLRKNSGYRPIDNDWGNGQMSFPEEYEEWVSMIGGEKIAFLKEFTSQFRLA